MIEIAILAPTLALRTGLRAILDAAEYLSVVVEGVEIAALGDTYFDVLVAAEAGLDFEALARLVVDFEDPPALLCLCETAELAATLSAMPLRAWGIVTPDADEDTLHTAVRALSLGLVVGSRVVMQAAFTTTGTIEDDDNGEQALTTRELEVLDLLADGLANKQIAFQLEISEHTVKFHVSSIYTKLVVTNRAEAVRTAARLGLIVL